MQIVKTFYWQTDKKESTAKAMENINNMINSGYYVEHFQVAGLGNTMWVCAVVVFEELEVETNLQEKSVVNKKNHLEQIAETWGNLPQGI